MEILETQNMHVRFHEQNEAPTVHKLMNVLILSHRIHGAAIYGNIYHLYTPNVSIYIPYMDPMGMWKTGWTISLQVEGHADWASAKKETSLAAELYHIWSKIRYSSPIPTSGIFCHILPIWSMGIK